VEGMVWQFIVQGFSSYWLKFSLHLGNGNPEIKCSGKKEKSLSVYLPTQPFG
jgi:hypothetical protein